MNAKKDKSNHQEEQEKNVDEKETKDEKISTEHKKKYCPNCGKQINAEASFCEHCGKRTMIENNNPNNIVVPNSKINGYSLAGFAVSIISIFTCGLTSIIGIILSCIGLSNSKKEGKTDGLAIAGIVISSISIILLFVIFLGGSSTDTSSTKKIDEEPKRKTVTVVDFASMTEEERNSWCDENNIRCIVKEEYSDTIESGMFISQSVDPKKEIDEWERIEIIFSKGKEPTISQQNAVKKANSYLRVMAFSRDGLIRQLEYEGFSQEDATYGVDNITVDWNEQAVKKAKSYLDIMAFSRDGLINQLEYEGFTHEQAIYGVEQNGF